MKKTNKTKTTTSSEVSEKNIPNINPLVIGGSGASICRRYPERIINKFKNGRKVF